MPPRSKPAFYAVSNGRQPGVYLTWDECEAQVKGFNGARYKKFTNASEAETWAGFTPSVPSTRTANPPNPPTNIFAAIPAAKTANTQYKAREVSPGIEDESTWDVVYSDGACKGNGQPGSYAGIGVWWGSNDPRNIAERCPGDQTNNRAELIAIARVLESTPHTKKSLLIKTDSQYSIKCFREWLPNWMKNNFISSSGTPVKNAAVIRYISALLDLRARGGQRVKLQYVQGHSGNIGNDGADLMANQGSLKELQSERDWDSLAKKTYAMNVGAASRATVEVEDPDGRVTTTTSTSSVAPTHSAPTPDEDDLQLYAASLLSDDEIEALQSGKSRPQTHELVATSSMPAQSLNASDLETYAAGLLSDEDLADFDFDSD